MENIDTAFKQWAIRPEDERFDSIESLEANALASKNKSGTSSAVTTGFQAKSVGEDGLILEGKSGRQATISNLASRQLGRRLEIPTALFDCEGEQPKFSSKVVADVINDRIKRAKDDKPLSLYVENNGADVPLNIRCITSDKYRRVHDYTIIQGIKPMLAAGFRVPPARPALPNQKGTRPATEVDLLKFGNHANLQVKLGDPIAPAGLYRGDEDMFVILVDDQNPIDDGTGRQLIRSRIITNSEVGEGAFSITEILHDTICGNHCIWGVNKLVELSYRHLGDNAVERIMSAMRMETIARPDFSHELKALDWMRKNKLGQTVKEVVDNVYNLNLGNNITKKLLKQSIDQADKYRGIDADPFTYAGLFQAVTRQSQLSKKVSQRILIDGEIAGLMKIAKRELALV